MQRREERII